MQLGARNTAHVIDVHAAKVLQLQRACFGGQSSRRRGRVRAVDATLPLPAAPPLQQALRGLRSAATRTILITKFINTITKFTELQS